MQTHSNIVKTTAQPVSQQQNKTETDGKDGLLKSEPPVLFQAKLSVGSPDDPFEQEADKVSRQVMDNYEQVASVQRKLFTLGLQTSIQPLPIGTSISRKLQRRLFRRPVVQFKCDQCEKEEKDEKLHAKTDRIQFEGDGAMVSSQIESGIQTQKGSGNNMDPITQTAMENSFGADFGSVKIHTDSTAVQLSRDLNAHAFTVGNDIFFNEGRYQPQTKWGTGLLAHELTHVVQQGAAVQNKTVSRLPYSELFSNNNISKLSSVGGSAMQQATLYRKEIEQFQKEVPEESMLMQQQQMLQAKEIDKVQTHSNAKTLRKYGGNGGSGGSSAAPKLTQKTVSGKAPKGGNCGEFSWTVQWILDNPSPSGGWVVQKVNVNRDVKDCKGNNVPVSSGLNPAWYPIWEAWQINKGQKVTTYAETGDLDDDGYGSNSQGDGTKGKMEVIGKAEFYEGLTLPPSFKVTNKAPAWILPVTTTDPNLKGGSGGIGHNLTAAWDCCGADKSTKLTTV
jgi:Domain of unknown function (DUF4157)